MRSVFGLEEGNEQAATRRAVPDATVSSSSQSSVSQMGDCQKEDEVGRSGRQPWGLNRQADVPSRGFRGAAGRALLVLLLLGLCGQTLQQVGTRPRSPPGLDHSSLLTLDFIKPSNLQY